MFSVTVDNAAALAALARYAEGARALGRTSWTAASSLPYAGPVERGRTLSGRWVRRAGPARMFEQGTAAALPRLYSYLADGLPYGQGGVDNAFRRWARIEWLPAIRQRTPVKTGALRGSEDVRGG